jgi:hypothetical protein
MINTSFSKMNSIELREILQSFEREENQLLTGILFLINEKI